MASSPSAATSSPWVRATASTRSACARAAGSAAGRASRWIATYLTQGSEAKSVISRPITRRRPGGRRDTVPSRRNFRCAV